MSASDEVINGWRECADPVELAAAVAAGVEVLCVTVDGRTWETGCEDSESFRRCMANDCRYRVPASWSPEPPAPATDDDLRERIVKVIDDWHNTVEMWSELDDLADAVLAVLPPSPVPPWPGAVLSGCVDEDGVPTWLAQAGDVRGEMVRGRVDHDWGVNDYIDTVWVEVRAPRAVPAPETARVPWWEAVEDDRDVTVAQGGPTFSAWLRLRDPEGGWWLVVNGCTDLATAYKQKIAPDGTVEVLKR